MSIEVRECPYRKKCGGCVSVGKAYEATLHEKEKRVYKLLRPYVLPAGIVGMDNPYHYRNKVHAVFAHVKEGRREKNIAGIYKEGTHRVVDIRGCLIEDEKAGAIVRDVLAVAEKLRIRIYDEDTGFGLLRHVLIRTAHATGQIMVVLVAADKTLPESNRFVKELLALHPEITTIVLNVNDRQTSMVLGETERPLYGDGYIEDVLAGCRFRISSSSFYQVNSLQTEKLYEKAIELANLTGRERVIDAYCGIGTIGIAASKQAREVIGVELNPDAAADAEMNARMNRRDNIRFYRQDATAFLKAMAAEGEMADVIFMDPPRAGSTEGFMEAACAMRPGRIVYISCDPETLARDLEYFTSHGYTAREALAFDMFPFTRHVESVVLLTRGGKGKRLLSDGGRSEKEKPQAAGKESAGRKEKPQAAGKESAGKKESSKNASVKKGAVKKGAVKKDAEKKTGGRYRSDYIPEDKLTEEELAYRNMYRESLKKK